MIDTIGFIAPQFQRQRPLAQSRPATASFVESAAAGLDCTTTNAASPHYLIGITLKIQSQTQPKKAAVSAALALALRRSIRNAPEPSFTGRRLRPVTSATTSGPNAQTI